MNPNQEVNQQQIQRVGEDIFKSMESESQSIFNKDWWYGKVMEWSMRNESFKTQMFRFVDVLPYLKSGSEVARHLKEYFTEGDAELPAIFNIGFGVGSLAPGLVAGAVRKNVTQMAKMFIAGETPEDAIPILKKARAQKLGFTVDLLGEVALSEKEALDYQSKYLELINWISKESESWPQIEQIDTDALGNIPKVNVSIKLSSLYSQINTKAWDQTKTILKSRLRPMFQVARDRGVFVNLDMEHYALKDLTLEVFREMIMEPEFKDYPHWGIVIQAYLRDAESDLEKLIQFARDRKTPFTIRLVKGAYWDYETILSQQRGWPCPVYLNKWESDASYERCSRKVLGAYPNIKVAFGSHNVRSISAAIVHAEKLGLSPKSFEIQMLYGMAEPIKRTLIQKGYRLRDYSPIGELIPGMAYLVRRLLENTSNESFLRSKFAENVSTEKLLSDPQNHTAPLTAKPTYAFENEPLLDFGILENREKLLAALKQAKKNFGKKYSSVIAGKNVESDQWIESVNPSNPTEIIGRVSAASKTQCLEAIEFARQTSQSWKRTSWEERAVYLDRLADLMSQRRFELIATQVYEVGKPWAEADGDVAEAIDFCRYYAMDARKIGQSLKVGHIPAEDSRYHYVPRGVSAVIAPWNFPLAILAGMVAASAVTGNTVIMKPAEQSSVVAAQLMEMIQQIGLPKGVVQFLPGYGEEVGATLVKDPRVQLIAFTGSRAVGLEILKQTTLVSQGQDHLKKCIIEMGGKNAIIVDSDADMDEAIQGVLYSAFGFAGQKCSACSRAIVLEENYDRFVDRLLEAARSLTIASAEDPNAYLGPVIDKEAYERIQKTIQNAKSEARLLHQGEAPANGYYIAPTIFVDVDPRSSLAQEEIFGPVLAVIKAKDLDQALHIANDTMYGLTGGVYSRSPANIQRVKEEFMVGNLYVNRQITGALVDRHPFGGFKMSGVGSKTGGPDYLKQFVEPRVVTENTMRRGFAPVE